MRARASTRRVVIALGRAERNPTVMRKPSEGSAWIMTRPLLLAVCVVFMFALSGPSSQKFDWQPSPGHTQVPIWPGKAPDPQPVKEPEFALSSGTNFLVAGKSATEVNNVTQPTMTVYSPSSPLAVTRTCRADSNSVSSGTSGARCLPKLWPALKSIT